MSLPSAFDLAQWVVFGLLLPAVCLWMLAEAAIRYADRRARMAHQERREAARALRDGRA